MGANQGLLRYTIGYTRKLTNSELVRGYLFISNDKNIKGNDKLEITIEGRKFEGKKIDGSGRIIVGREILRQIGKKNIHFKLDDNHLSIATQ